MVSPGLSKPRARLAAAGAGHYIVFAGGVYEGFFFWSCLFLFVGDLKLVSDQTGWLDDVDVFDTDTNQFNAIFAPLSEARSDLAAAAIGNKLIFAGGRLVKFFFSLLFFLFLLLLLLTTSPSGLASSLSRHALTSLT